VRRPLLLLLLFIGLSLLTRGLFIPVEILDMDEAAHAVGSWTFMDGGILYRDFVNNKPPMLYFYYAFAQWIFGRGIVPVHFLTALIVVPLTSLAVAAYFDYDKRGTYGGILYLIFSSAFLAHDMHSTSAEILMVLPGAWAIVFARKENFFLSGLLFGFGFLFKYQIALGILAVVFAYWRRLNWKLFLLLAGFLVPPLAIIGYFRAIGAYDELVYWLVRNNLLYSANPITFHEAIGRAASYLLPFLIVTLPLWWTAYRNRNEKMIFALLLVSIPPLFVGFRFYPHYFIQLYFPLIVLASFTINKRLLIYAVSLCILFTGINAYLYFGNMHVYRERDPVYRTVAERLEQDSNADRASLFVWGYAPAFYYYAGLKPASRFVVMGQARLTGYVSGNLGSLDRESQQGVPQHWDWLMADLEKNHAVYILDTSPAGIYRWNHYPMEKYPRLQKYVSENYQRMGEIEGVVIYRRR
jgi:4-amino-4-deoxy-L-arabinose transferase-like glycosyltransferase